MKKAPHCEAFKWFLIKSATAGRYKMLRRIARRPEPEIVARLAPVAAVAAVVAAAERPAEHTSICTP